MIDVKSFIKTYGENSVILQNATAIKDNSIAEESDVLSEELLLWASKVIINEKYM